MTVSGKDVSVVVQGPVGAWLPDVLASVRRHLPAAEIVLSTWRDAPVAGLDADVVVRSEDPGSVPYRLANGAEGRRAFNTNRMLRSARAGLARTTRGHVLKLRTDTPLCDVSFLDWFAQDRPSTPELRIFGQRVVTLSVATRPSDRSLHFLFHPSDCVHFGRREDLLLLWAADEIDEDLNASYWQRRDPDKQARPFPGAGAQFWNEQVLWLGALRAAGQPVDYPYTGYLDPAAQRASDVSIVTNFLVLEPWQFGVRIPKLQEMVTASDPEGYLSFDDWLTLERAYCAS